MERSHHDWLNILYMPHTEVGLQVLELVLTNRKKTDSHRDDTLKWQWHGLHFSSMRCQCYLLLQFWLVKWVGCLAGSVGVVTLVPRNMFRFLAGERQYFCLVQNPHAGCESRSASFDSVAGAISSSENGRGRKVITHFKLLQRLRISGEISPSHHMSSICAQGHIYLSFIVWLIYGWSFLQHVVLPFPSSTLLTKFKFYTCLQSCTAY